MKPPTIEEVREVVEQLAVVDATLREWERAGFFTATDARALLAGARVHVEATELSAERLVIEDAEREFGPTEKGSFESDDPEPFDEPEPCRVAGCAGHLVLRHSARGAFYGCSKYPACRGIVDINEPR